jgi:hypothetical protein
MQFVLEVGVLEWSFLKHSQGILGAKILIRAYFGGTLLLIKC